MRKLIHLAVLGLCLQGCAKQQADDDDGNGSDEGPLLPLPPDGGQQFASTTYTLQPGEEKYICWTAFSPMDKAVSITRIDSISMPGVHHMGVYQAFGRNEENGEHECPTLQKQTWLPILGTGTGNNTLALPEGVGFLIQPDTQYILQLHLQNTSDDVMHLRGGVNFTYSDDTSLQQAGIYAFGTEQFAIPAQTDGYEVKVHCDGAKNMNVFGVLPHMHKLGTSISLTRNGTDFYHRDPWVFGEQPLAPMTQTVSASDTFDLSCKYNNDGTAAVSYGESSDEEMCFFALFYYPFDGLDGCVVGA